MKILRIRFLTNFRSLFFSLLNSVICKKIKAGAYEIPKWDYVKGKRINKITSYRKFGLKNYQLERFCGKNRDIRKKKDF